MQDRSTRNLKGQGALEFLSAYSFVFLIMAIVLIVIVVFVSTQKTITSPQCSFYSGFSCSESGIAINTTTGRGSVLYILAVDDLPGVLNITGFSASILNTSSTSGSCNPSSAGQGQLIYCKAVLPITTIFGSQYSATFKIQGHYCTPSLITTNVLNCPPTSNTLFTYTGYTNAQTTSNIPAFVSTSIPTTTIPTILPPLILQTPSLSPNSFAKDNDQNLNAQLTATLSGGKPRYTVTWYSNSVLPCDANSVLVAVHQHILGTTDTYTVSNPLSNAFYCVSAKDSSATPVISSVSAPSNIVVNSQLVQNGGPTAVSYTLTLGQSENFGFLNPGTAVTTGTQPYAYQFYSGTNSISCTGTGNSKETGSGNYQSGVSGTVGYTFTPSFAGTVYLCATITDSASTPETVSSTTTAITVIGPLLLSNTITPSYAAIDNGQSITLTGTPPLSGGNSLSYAYHWEAYDSHYYGQNDAWLCGSPYLTNYVTSSNNFNPGTISPTINSIVCFREGDSPTNKYWIPGNVPYVTANIIVNPALLAGAPTASNTVVDVGQSTTLTSQASAGTLPYSYAWSTNVDCSSPIGGATSNTLTVTPASTVTYYYQVTDNALTPVALCSAGVAVTVNPTMFPTKWTISNSIVDIGQWETVNSAITGGTSTFTYNDVIYDSGHTLRANQILSGLSITSNTFTFQVTGSFATGTATANTYVKDSANNVVSNTLTFTINSALAAATPTASNNPVNQPQSTTLTSHASGGSASYSYTWSTHSDCSSPIGGATSSTYIVAPTTTTTYYYQATDTGTTTSVSACSAGVAITVIPSVQSVKFTISNATIDMGQYETINSVIVGNYPTFTYNDIVIDFGGSTRNTLLVGGLSVKSNTFTFQANGWTSGSASAYTYVTDSLGTVASNTISFTVNYAMIISAPTASNSVISPGGSSTLTSHLTQGTPPYTAYAWSTHSDCSSPIGGATSSTYVASPASTTTYYYKVTADSASTPAASACSTGVTVTVTSAVMPSNIIHYVNITLQNTQGSATTALMPVMIPVNTIKYNAYINGNANNVEFFYPNNDVVATSWMEGNILNPMQTTGMNTIANSIFWVKLNPTIAGSGTSVNVIALGFAMMANNILSNTITGESPLLTGTYAQYDDGAKVFSFYENFYGTTLSSSTWTKSGSSNVVVSNGVSVGSTSGWSGIATNAYSYNPNALAANPLVLDIFGYADALATQTQLGIYPNNGFASNRPQIQVTTGQATCGTTAYYVAVWDGSLTCSGTGNLGAGSVTSPNIFSEWTSGSTFYSQIKYGTQQSVAYSGNYPGGVSAHPTFVTATANPHYVKLNLVRTRIMPPGNVNPIVTYATSVI